MWVGDQRGSLQDKEAKLCYRHGVYEIIQPGTFVRCAVTGAEILLDNLRYWSVERQEAYASAEAALKRVTEHRIRHT